jgi:hypothetical protein
MPVDNLLLILLLDITTEALLKESRAHPLLTRFAALQYVCVNQQWQH